MNDQRALKFSRTQKLGLALSNMIGNSVALKNGTLRSLHGGDLAEWELGKELGSLVGLAKVDIFNFNINANELGSNSGLVGVSSLFSTVDFLKIEWMH